MDDRSSSADDARPGIRRGPSRRRVLSGIGVAGLMTLVGPGGASGILAGPAGARAASGRIVVYSTTLPPIQRQLTEAFTRKTGIQVQSLRLVNNPLAQRFVAEQRAGQHICDVVTLGIDVFYEEISREGMLADIGDVPGVSALPEFWRTGRQYVNIMYGPQSIGYNTNAVTGASIPQTWADVLKPEFAGQILMPDPRANDTIVAFLDMLRTALGDDFLRALGAQRPKLVPTVPQGVEQVIAGEGKLILPCLAMNLIQYQGMNAPISLIPTPSPTQGTHFYTGIAAKAPNMEGARAWLEYILSPEGQEILCKDNGVSPLGDIPGSLKAPESLQKIDIALAMERSGQIYDLLGLAA